MYSSSIQRVRFGATNDKMNLANSVVPITTYELFRNGDPYVGGIYDKHLGTTDFSYVCATCNQHKKLCPGHFGSLKLHYPVISPMSIRVVHKWLKAVCHKCGAIHVQPRELMGDIRKRLSVAADGAKPDCVCRACKAIHPKVTVSDIFIFTSTFSIDKKPVDVSLILPHQIKDIFSRISNEDVELLGRTIESHPEHFLQQVWSVPPTTIRPDVKRGGGRSANDDITTMLQYIVRANDAMPETIPQNIDDKFIEKIKDLNLAIWDLIKGGGGNRTVRSGTAPANNFAVRLTGKKGRFRKNILGKRAHNMGRSTITGNPRIHANALSIPISHAQKIQFCDTVQSYNRKQLYTYILNGRERYPGCTKVVKASTRNEYTAESFIRNKMELLDGDIVYYDMINGEYVGFNRQPSLSESNICAHMITVMENPEMYIYGMNVLATKLYNADFDGDAMNIIVNKTRSERYELQQRSGVHQRFISSTTCAPQLGQVDDSIIGCFELSREWVKLNKFNAMAMFGYTTYIPQFTKKEYSGWDIISMILESTPITLERKTKYFTESNANFIKYAESEKRLQIKAGEMVSGVLDSSNIGAGAAGGLYHVIASEYGSQRALDQLFNMQQLALQYMLLCGYTVDISDLLLSLTAKNQIDIITNEIKAKSDIITEKLHRGEIIPPIGLTVEQFYEQQQITNLIVLDEFAEPILESIDPLKNHLFKIIACGSKGKIENMFNMTSCVGQKLINGNRIKLDFGIGRTLAHFRRYETDPVSRGFIENSYISGLNVDEYIFNAMNARNDLTIKALSTSVTGEQNRNSVKNLENIITNNFRAAVKNSNYLQQLYGEDGFDARHIESCQFSTVTLNNETFEKTYKHPDYPNEFKLICEDRDWYRKQFANLENSNYNQPMSDKCYVPINAQRIIYENVVLNENNKTLIKPQDVVKMLEALAYFNKLLAYVYLNELSIEANYVLPDFLIQATRLTQMLLRIELCANNIIQKNITLSQMGQILDKVWLRYTQALIEPGQLVGITAAQSFSEPLVQYTIDAHHRSASGGSSQSAMVKVKEILGAKEIENLINPTMLIRCNANIESDQIRVQEVANNIEQLRLSQFVQSVQIFYEPFGKPQHSNYIHEINMINDFIQLRSLQPPGDLLKWCIRFQISTTQLLLKNIKMETVATSLRKNFPDCTFVHNHDTHQIIFIRVYLRSVIFKDQPSLSDIREYKDKISQCILRGVDGCVSATVEQLMRTITLEDGSMQLKKVYGINTVGVNIWGIWLLAQYSSKNENSDWPINCHTIQSDAIMETLQVYGIEAARSRIIAELRTLVSKCNYRHYTIYADEMTHNGLVTNIERGGMGKRESGNTLLRIGYSSPMLVLSEAYVNGSVDNVNNLTGCLIMGQVANVGTTYNELFINEDFITENVKSNIEYLDDI